MHILERRCPGQVDGQSHVVHSEEEPMGTRLTIDSLTCLLANETDPSRLVAVSPGKLVRYLVEDGAHVNKDQPYIEIEVLVFPSPLPNPCPPLSSAFPRPNLSTMPLELGLFRWR